jgi:hypothetical protein
MKKRTVRGIYDDGELRFAEPVDVDGCWKLEITFVEREDIENIPLVANPHHPEQRPKPDRLEQMHRDLESIKPTINQY